MTKCASVSLEVNIPLLLKYINYTPEIYKLHSAQGSVSTAVESEWLPLSHFPPGKYPETWIS